MHCIALALLLKLPLAQSAHAPLLVPPQPSRNLPAAQVDVQVLHALAPAARLYEVPAGQAVLTVDTLVPTLPPPGHAKPAAHCARLVADALAP